MNVEVVVTSKLESFRDGHLSIDKALLMKQNCDFQEGLTDIKSTVALFFFKIQNRGILEISNKVLNIPLP